MKVINTIVDILFYSSIIISISLLSLAFIIPIYRKIKSIQKQSYLVLRNDELKGNIDLYEIGQRIELKDKRIIKVLNKTTNSLLVFVPKKSIDRRKRDKNGEFLYTHAVNSTEWFTIEEFERRFIKSNQQ